MLSRGRYGCGFSTVKPDKSPFVAIGALLGIEMFRGNSKHIITLNADAMNDRLVLRIGLTVMRNVRVIHGKILT